MAHYYFDYLGKSISEIAYRQDYVDLADARMHPLDTADIN